MKNLEKFYINVIFIFQIKNIFYLIFKKSINFFNFSRLIIIIVVLLTNHFLIFYINFNIFFIVN